MRSPLRQSVVVLLAAVLAAGLTGIGAAPTPAVAAPTDVVSAPAARGTTIPPARIGSLNLPGGDFNNQAQLLDQPRRTQAALNFLNRRGVTVVALQELSTPSRKLLRRSKAWAVVSAPPNSTRGRSTIGNAIAYRTKRWALVSTDHLHIPVASRPRGLNMAVATLRRRGTNERVVVMSIHHPINSEVNAKRVRERSKKLEVRYLNRVHRRTGYPVVIAGDANERDAQARFGQAGFDLGVRHVFDLVTAKGAGLDNPQVFVDNVYLRFSDHALVTADLRLRR